MSDFFTRLAQRLTDTQSILRPRLPSRFETPPEEATVAAPEAPLVAEERGESLPPPEPRQDIPPPAVEMPIAQEVRATVAPLPVKKNAKARPLPVPAATAAPTAVLPPLEENVFTPPPAFAVPVVSDTVQAKAVTRPVAVPSPSTIKALAGETPPLPATVNAKAPPLTLAQNPEQPTTSPVEPQMRREPPPFAPPPPLRAQSVLQPLPREAPQQTPAQQTVQVTIGRIEIRATSDAAAPRRAPDASPVMSLEAYLSSRAKP